MANLLSTAISVSNAVTAVDNIDVSGSSLTNAGISAALSAATAISAGQGVEGALSAGLGAGLGSIPGANTIAGAVGDVGGLLGIGGLAGIGGLSGSKPGALHTEYASGGASWGKPYGAGTDIVFYLMRADGGAGGSGAAGPLADAAASAGFGDAAGLSGVNEGLASAAGAVSEGVVPADVVAGAGLPSGMPSSLNQVASAAAMTGSIGSAFSPVASLAGPLTGMSDGLSTATGLYTSATAAINNPSISNITNAVASTGAFGDLSNIVTTSVAASEAFFNETLNTSFNSDIDSSGYVIPLDAAPVSEFSSAMATMTGAVTSTTDFVKGINDGSYGYTSTGANAEMERTDSSGFTLY